MRHTGAERHARAIPHAKAAMTHPQKTNRFRWPACALLALASCSTTAAEHAWSNAEQMIVVTTAGWDSSSGTLQRHERRDGDWHALDAAQPVVIGRAGSAWGIGLHAAQSGRQKKEGDGRSPAGVFGLGTGFGYSRSIVSGWPYAPMDAGDWCIDVVDSPLYNRLVDARDVGADAIAGSTEPMRRDLHADRDMRYKLGFVVGHNPHNVAGAGSCIFAHLWSAADSTTAGCTAMPERAMQRLLGWLQPTAHPVFVLLPEHEYERLRQAWGLPPITPRAGSNR